MFGDKKECDEDTPMGINVTGSSRSGKWEISGVLGGGRIRENSDAKEDNGVCFGESAINKLVLASSRVINDCGVISFA